MSGLTPRSRTARLARLGLVAALGATALAGCSPTESVAGLHAPPAQNMGVAPISEELATSIVSRVSQAAAVAATKPADDTGAAERAAVLSGTFADLLTSRISISGVTPTTTSLSRSQEPKVLAVSQGEDFPRVILATTRDPETNKQYLESFVSADVTARFHLENRVPMVAGSTLPALTDLKAGAPLVDVDEAEGLDLSPKAALEAYAGALTYPSPAANEVVDTSDPFATVLAANQKKQAEALGSLASYEVTQTSVPEAIRAFRLADGSAVVFGRINRADVLKAGENTKELTVPEAYQKLVGTSTATSSITINSMQPVVLLVPAQGKGKVKLLGVVEQLVSGSAS